jgi:pimeloyl-ACP methyl ester carboxylesterase
MIRGEWISELVKRYRYLAFIDNCGHGITTTVEPLEFCSIIENELEHPDLIGYSMGGRLALLSAMHHTHPSRRIVAMSANLGRLDPAARQTRLTSDCQLGEKLRLLEDPRPLGADEAPFRAFLADWNANPLFGRRSLGQTEVRTRLRSDPDLLATAVVSCSSANLPDLSSMDPGNRVLYMVGEYDRAYISQLNWVKSHTAWQIEVVPGAHHDTLADNPAFVWEKVQAFLS